MLGFEWVKLISSLFNELVVASIGENFIMFILSVLLAVEADSELFFGGNGSYDVINSDFFALEIFIGFEGFHTDFLEDISQICGWLLQLFVDLPYSFYLLVHLYEL